MSGECLRKRHAKVLEYGKGVLKSVGAQERSKQGELLEKRTNEGGGNFAERKSSLAVSSHSGSCRIFSFLHS